MTIEIRFLSEELRKYRIYKDRYEEITRIKERDKFLIEELEKYYKRIEYFIRAVERAIANLSCLHQDFFENYYIKKKGIEKITIEMALTQYTVERIKREIIEEVAKELGFFQD